MSEESADLLVIGGGIVGSLTALAGVDAGLRVVLLERRAGLFQATSRAGFGSLTPFSDPFFSGTARDLAFRGMDLYRSRIVPSLAKDVGVTVPFCETGLIEILDSASSVHAAARLLKDLASAGYANQARLVSRAEVLAMEPNLASDFEEALILNEPWLDTDDLFEGLRRKMAIAEQLSVSLSTTVQGLDGNGSSWVVDTLDGRRFKSPAIVLATGVATQHPAGVARPKLELIRGDAAEVINPSGKELLGTHVYRPNSEGVTDGPSLQCAGFITPRHGGRLWLGATYEREENADSARREGQIGVRQIAALLDSNSRILPAIMDCELVRTWRGWRPSTSDGFPIVGEGQSSGIVYAVGCKGLGLTMAPAVAECVVEGVTSGNWSRTPTEFSAIRPGALEAT